MIEPGEQSVATHRLPTQSAFDALQSLQEQVPIALSTGLPTLDASLASANGQQPAGLARGQVVEVFGPPGSGKTALGLQLCASAIRQGSVAVWIDTAAPLSTVRLSRILSSATLLNGSDGWSHRFHHFEAPTLPHLLALLMHGDARFPPKGAGIIVVDTVSSLFERAYAHGERKAIGIDASRWAAARKFAVMTDLVRRLAQIAAVHDLAVILIGQCATKLRYGAPAILQPSLTSREWDSNILTQIALFGDKSPAHPRDGTDSGRQRRTYYAVVSRVKGVGADSDAYEPGTRIPFTVEPDGIVEMHVDRAQLPATRIKSPLRPVKRAYEEIADSEESDGDYGWDGEDELATEALIP